ncbi:KTSC domain-containing protein [Granulicella sp. L60]|uniref:KTSC domain-containing protein n=1 Tax=Granulicella sp. L60 TaxID=1641866 RepID=UPI00131D5883|nr:KTSC domain-containing protein [Granulicella sp. L60]
MKRIRVDSMSIASIGYLLPKRELEIEFRDSGDVYCYFDVPEEIFAAFMAAESKGTYLNQVFKPRKDRYVLILEGKKPRP